MLTGIRQLAQCLSRVIWGGMLLFLLICLFLFSSCGTSQADQSLTSGTPVDQNSPTTTTTTNSSSQILPITVMNGQTNVSTYPGGYMTLTISTSPYAVSTFVISYGLSNPSKALGIVPRTADASGIASWKWQVESGAHTGTWPLTISATLPSGARTSSNINVTVTFPSIAIVSSQTNLSGSRKADLMLTIATAPSMDCTLLLNYGPGIESRTLTRGTGSNGIASWNWKVDNNANPGVYPLTVTVTLPDGESSSIQVNMTVL